MLWERAQCNAFLSAISHCLLAALAAHLEPFSERLFDLDRTALLEQMLARNGTRVYCGSLNIDFVSPRRTVLAHLALQDFLSRNPLRVRITNLRDQKTELLKFSVKTDTTPVVTTALATPKKTNTIAITTISARVTRETNGTQISRHNGTRISVLTPRKDASDSIRNALASALNVPEWVTIVALIGIVLLLVTIAVAIVVFVRGRALRVHLTKKNNKIRPRRATTKTKRHSSYSLTYANPYWGSKHNFTDTKSQFGIKPAYDLPEQLARSNTSTSVPEMESKNSANASATFKKISNARAIVDMFTKKPNRSQTGLEGTGAEKSVLHSLEERAAPRDNEHQTDPAFTTGNDASGATPTKPTEDVDAVEEHSTAEQKTRSLSDDLIAVAIPIERPSTATAESPCTARQPGEEVQRDHQHSEEEDRSTSTVDNADKPTDSSGAAKPLPPSPSGAAKPLPPSPSGAANSL